MNNKGADQTAQMRRLICAFVVRIWQNRFSNDGAQFIFPNKTANLSEFLQMYFEKRANLVCPNILWEMKSLDTSHMPMYGVQLIKFGSLHEEYYILAYPTGISLNSAGARKCRLT